jgi:hypothetical protein
MSEMFDYYGVTASSMYEYPTFGVLLVQCNPPVLEYLTYKTTPKTWGHFCPLYLY